MDKTRMLPKTPEDLSVPEFLALEGNRCPICMCAITLEVVPECDIGDLANDNVLEHNLKFKCNHCNECIEVTFNAVHFERGHS